MKKLLLIALLIVGCDNSISTNPTQEQTICEKDICELKWILYDNTEPNELSLYLYWIEEHNQVIIRDTSYFNNDTLYQEYYEVDKIYYSINSLNDKSIVKNIYHYKTNNHFTIKFDQYNDNDSIIVNANDCSKLKYEYK